MNDNKTKIQFIGVSVKTSTFIKRRIKGLEKENISIIIPKENISKSITYLLFKFLIKPKRFINFIKIIRLQNIKNWKLKIKNAIKYVDFIENKPDILHFQWIHHVKSFEWLIKYYNVPVVASVRGSMVTIYPHNNPQYVKELKQSFNLTDYVHCVSESLRQICITDFEVSPDKVFTNYNGIDINFFKPNLKKKHQKNLTIISVGSLMWRKGNLLQLLILKKLEKHPIKLILVGDGEDKFKLQYQIKRLGLSKKVFLIGEKDEKEISELLQQSDLYLSTSIAEGLSNSVMEAASSGLPTVAFDCEGMSEIIIENKTGYIIPFGEIDTMSKAILELLEDKEKRIIFGMNARKHVVENFEITKHIKEMVNFYQSIVK